MEIEKGIPIPPGVRGSKTARTSFHWAMEVGDSVLMPEGMSINQVTARVHTESVRKAGRKYTTRTVEGGRVRVWRIE